MPDECSLYGPLLGHKGPLLGHHVTTKTAANSRKIAGTRTATPIHRGPCLKQTIAKTVAPTANRIS